MVVVRVSEERSEHAPTLLHSHLLDLCSILGAEAWEAEQDHFCQQADIPMREQAKE